MKQAWGWLMTGVVAAGMNASYHNGGMEWAHRIADRVSHETNAVLALATGNAGRFYREARVIRVAQENKSQCQLSLAMARVQENVQRAGPLSDVALAQFERVSDREQAQVDRLEAQGDRIKARLARIQVPAVQLSAIDMPEVDVPEVDVPEVNVPAVHVSGVRVPALHVASFRVQPVTVKIPDVHVCPRVRVNVPRMPAINIPAIPAVDVEIPSADPI